MTNPVSLDAPWREVGNVLRQIAVSRSLSIRKLELLIDPDLPDRWLNLPSQGLALPADGRIDVVLDWAGLTAEEHTEILWAIVQGEARNAEPMLRAAFSPRLVVISALNYDHIAPASTMRDRLVNTDVPKQGRESRADTEEEIDHLIAQIGVDRFTVHRPGGSAFQVGLMVSSPTLGISTGVIGSAGRPPDVIGEEPDTRPCHVSTHADITTDRLDTTFLHRSEARGGRTVSVLQPSADGQPARGLRPFQGCNVELRRHLIENFWPIVAYLAGAQAIHISSLIDPATTQVLSHLIEAVVRRAPAVRISMDPGDIWSGEPNPEVARLLRSATTLFVNGNELQALATNYADTDPLDGSDERADKLGRLLRGPDTTVILKQPAATVIYQPEHPPLHVPLKGEQVAVVEDDTGAGDTFAAGYLAHELSARLLGRPAAEYGMAAAARKLTSADLPDLGFPA